ncbi:MAG: calcium/sodium antiporter [Bacteroidales bacterium]|nr:calcium/sodium antiporter [Bacteroidales bacterium]
MEYLLLLLGFILLLYGGKFLIKGGVALADKFNLSSLVIGLTLVSFGTSAPELFVSVVAAIKGHPDVAIGNVIGSNIANISLVLALTAIIIPIPVRSNSVKIDAPFMLLVSFLLWAFLYNHGLARWEGALFLILIIGYSAGLFKFSKQSIQDKAKRVSIEKMKLWKIILLLILAYLGLAFGSDLLVDNASIIASNFGISERVIAISIVAFGTSLPELTTSLLAAIKGEMDISIGNIIGSNIFNILVVLGLTSLIKPISVDNRFLQFDIFWMLGVSIFLFLFILPLKGGKLTRIKASILFLIYCIYLYLLFFNNL